ncbi:hypothetical protein [Kitasatospora cineracea]|uniref:hypothetical protein n=1 Tax=Kitasatospora cineracea TaxID=88074 RepID=UPI0033D7BDA7
MPYDPSTIVELPAPSSPPLKSASEATAPAPRSARTAAVPWLLVWVADRGQWRLSRLVAWHNPGAGAMWIATVRESLDAHAPVRHLLFDPAVIEPVRNQPPHHEPGKSR